MIDELTQRKIIAIREELVKFRKVKRECKYLYKNWYKAMPIEESSSNSLDRTAMMSPKFEHLGGGHYWAHYGKFFITCLHILYIKLRECPPKKNHLIDVAKAELYAQGIHTINLWLEERLLFQSESSK